MDLLFADYLVLTVTRSKICKNNWQKEKYEEKGFCVNKSKKKMLFSCHHLDNKSKQSCFAMCAKKVLAVDKCNVYIVRIFYLIIILISKANSKWINLINEMLVEVRSTILGAASWSHSWESEPGSNGHHVTYSWL